MRGRRIGGTVPVLALAIACAAPASAAERVPGEVIVQFERAADAAERAGARADAGTAQPQNLGSRVLEVVQVADGGSVGETIDELESDPAVRFAEPNTVDRIFAVPNDHLFGQQWGMQNNGQSVAGNPGTADADIDAPAAWDIGRGDPSTVIAVLDTGAALNHPDLAPQLWRNPGEVAGNGVDDDRNGFVDDVNGWDFVSDDATPTDVMNHGTHVAGIAAGRGDDGVGVTGVSQRASLMVLRICAPPAGTCALDDQLQALNYAAAEGAEIVNGSFGGPSATESEARRSAIFSRPQILHVFAAGNEGDNVDTPPATYPCAHAPIPGEADNTLCVANTNSIDARSPGSNFGPVSVDLGAPGNFVLSASIFSDLFFDRMEAGPADFAVNWPLNTPPPNDWHRIDEAPLPNFGMTDSPGGLYDNDASYVISSREVSVPPGFSECELRYARSRDLDGGGDVFRIAVLRDNVVVDNSNFTSDDTFASVSLQIADGAIAAGGQVRIRLTLDTDAALQADGIHMDNMRLACEGNGHEYISGTSMATPHVAGAAGLLASRNPGADPEEVRNKILATVDPLGSLSGTTVTGGRLNVGLAMAAMPADTSITGGPADGSTISARQGGGPVKGAFATFSYSSNDPSASFQCSIDGAGFAGCGGGTQTIGPLGPGPHSFAVRSVDPRGNADTTPARRDFSVDGDPPETTITKSPKRKTRSRKAKFRFVSDEPDSTFQCKVDKKPFKPCTSPRKLKKVKRKNHWFKVVATDPVGNADPTVAKKKWKVGKKKRKRKR